MGTAMFGAASVEALNDVSAGVKVHLGWLGCVCGGGGYARAEEVSGCGDGERGGYGGGGVPAVVIGRMRRG